MKSSNKILRLCSFSSLSLLLQFLICTSSSYCQIDIIKQEKNLKHLYGKEKLEVLVGLASYYSENNNRKKGRYCRQAVILGENIAFLKSGDRDTIASILLCQAQFLLGQDLFERKKYWEAQENLERSRYLGDLIGISDFDVDIQKYLTEIQRREFSGEIKRNVFNRAVGNLKIGEKLSETAQDVMVKREMKKVSRERRKEI